MACSRSGEGPDVIAVLQRSWFWIGLTALLAAGSALHAFALLDAASLWGDELSTVHKAFRLTLPEMWRFLQSDSHPPLYYLLVHAWGRWLPQTGSCLRLLSWLAYVGAGLLLTAQARALARHAGADRPWVCGCLAALLAFSSPFPLHFALEGKGYSLMVLFVAAALMLRQSLLMGAAEGRGGPGRLVGFAVVLAMAAATHYYAFFLLLALGVVDLGMALRRTQPVRWGLLVAELLAVLPVSTWILLSREHLASGQGIAWIGIPDYGLLEDVLARFLGPWPLPRLVLLAVLLAVAFRLDRLRWAGLRHPPSWLTLADRSGVLPSLVMVVMVVALSFVRPFAFGRYFFILLPACSVGLALMLSLLRPAGRVGWCCALAFVGLAWVVASHDAFAELSVQGIDAGSKEGSNYRALSLRAAEAAPARFTLEPVLTKANASDHVLKQAGLLPLSLPAWRPLSGGPDAAERLPDTAVIGATGEKPVRELQRLRIALEVSGFRCVQAPALPAGVALSRCTRPNPDPRLDQLSSAR